MNETCFVTECRARRDDDTRKLLAKLIILFTDVRMQHVIGLFNTMQKQHAVTSQTMNPVQVGLTQPTSTQPYRGRDMKDLFRRYVICLGLF